MTDTGKERAITFKPSNRRGKEALDLNTLGETEEQLLQRAEVLRLRHEELMKANPEYASWEAQLSEYRDDNWQSGVPITEKATVEMINNLRSFCHYEERMRKWNQVRGKKKEQIAAAKREAKRIEKEEKWSK